MTSDLDRELEDLHERWLPIVAIAAIRRELGLSLNEAKAYLHDHPAGRDDLANPKWEETLDQLEAEMSASDDVGA
jgi:hypothetical protein